MINNTKNVLLQEEDITIIMKLSQDLKFNQTINTLIKEIKEGKERVLKETKEFFV